MAEEYLQTKVRGILEPMVNSMLLSCPDEPMRFMLTWLVNYTQGSDFTSNGEREELENLRKEIKKYQKLEKDTSTINENEIEEKKEKDIKKIEEKDNHIKNNLEEENDKKSEEEKEKNSEEEKEKNSEEEKDKNSEEEEKKSNSSKSNNSEKNSEENSSGYQSEKEDNISQQEFDNKIKEQRNKMLKRGQRSSVSAEAFGMFNKKSAFKPRVIPKTDTQKETIKSRCLQSFIFNALEDQDMISVIDAFEEKRYKAGEYVIKEGEKGDVVFLVDTGELDCEKTFKKGDPPTYLKTYKPGESFGELALLYNAPRAATIKAKTDCLLWALDRGTFNNIVKEAAVKKRERYENSLKNVHILSTIDAYELGQICDAVKSEKVEKGDYIIKQNEIGDKFYILDEGEAYAAKVFNEGEKEQIVKEYKSGDYFGELALLRDEPRAASVVAKTKCKLITLDRLAFKRLLGPLEKLLKRNSETYQKYQK
jgi:cAMP-dependent protein kinase regulator